MGRVGRRASAGSGGVMAPHGAGFGVAAWRRRPHPASLTLGHPPHKGEGSQV